MENGANRNMFWRLTVNIPKRFVSWLGATRLISSTLSKEKPLQSQSILKAANTVVVGIPMSKLGRFQEMDQTKTIQAHSVIKVAMNLPTPR